MRIDDYIGALPDSFQKGKNSNNYKLLLIEQKPVDSLRNDIDAVQNTLDIYTASGKTLDLYGDIYGQSRGSLTDDQYRYVIIQKALQCMCQGDANSIIKILSAVFNVQPSDFSLSDTENPCEVEVSKLPYSILQSIGVTVNQLKQMIQSVLPAGVKLAPLNLEGTFELCAVGDEETEGSTKGFGDIEQTTGGYFGYLEATGGNIPT